MLWQSHTGKIHLLPALPDAWPDGYVKDLQNSPWIHGLLEWKGNDDDATSGSCAFHASTCVPIGWR